MSMATRRETWDRLSKLRKQRRWKTGTNIALVILGPILAVVTYLGLGPFELDPSSAGIRLILLADLVYALVLAALVLQAVFRMISARRRGSVGSQLHLRLHLLLSLQQSLCRPGCNILVASWRQ